MEGFSVNGILGESEDLSGLVPEFEGESLTSSAIEFVEDISPAPPGIDEEEEEEVDELTKDKPEVKRGRVGFVFTDIATPGVSVYGK